MQENLRSIIGEDRPAISDPPPKYPVVKISSAIQKPATSQNEAFENGSKIKIEKENFDSPITPKKRKNKSRRKRRARFQESYHAYQNRIEMNKRHNHIRQWQNDYSSQGGNSAFGSPYNSGSNCYYENNNQHDSGYFSSPVQNSLLPSPCLMPMESVNSFSSRRILLPSEPYPFHQYCQQIPESFSPAPTRSQNNNRQVIFSHFPNNQHYGAQNFNEIRYKPIIDFASTNEIQFGNHY